MEDPALDPPDVRRDAAYSLDKLRYEQNERDKDAAKRQREILTALNNIKWLLFVGVWVLVYIAWRLTY